MESENYITCPTCGNVVDKRNPGEVLSHGVWNEETHSFECYDLDFNVINVTAKKMKGGTLEGS